MDAARVARAKEVSLLPEYPSIASIPLSRPSIKQLETRASLSKAKESGREEREERREKRTPTTSLVDKTNLHQITPTCMSLSRKTKTNELTLVL
jgi:hypothetical protein